MATNSLAWFSPSYSGLQFGALAEIDRADDESSLVESYLTARYRRGPRQLAVSYYDRSDNLRTNNVFRPDAKTAAGALQFRQSPHKAVLRYQHAAIKTQANCSTLGAYYCYNFHSGVALQGCLSASTGIAGRLSVRRGGGQETQEVRPAMLGIYRL